MNYRIMCMLNALIADESGQKGAGIALLVGTVTALRIFASQAVIRANGWLVMVVYALYGLGYAYFLWMNRPASSTPTD